MAEPFKNALKSEYGMWGKDFERYHKMLMDADSLSVEILSRNPLKINEYYLILKAIYRNFRPLAYETKRKDLDKKFNEVDKKIQSFHEDLQISKNRNMVLDVSDMDTTIFSDLHKIHSELLQLKQDCGLGVPAMKQLKRSTKIKRGIE